MKSGIKLIVGLGNPGPQYERTKHNVGFWLVSGLDQEYGSGFKPEPKFKSSISKIDIKGQKCNLMMPLTFMNLSGEAVGKFARFYKIDPESILIVHDELDFSPGVVRLKKSGGANGHNGVQSVMDHLGTKDFWRLRIGVGKPAIKDDMSKFVLSSFKKTDLELVNDALNRAMAIVQKLVFGEFEKAMMELH